jgi:hypothetical protein
MLLCIAPCVLDDEGYIKWKKSCLAFLEGASSVSDAHSKESPGLACLTWSNFRMGDRMESSFQVHTCEAKCAVKTNTDVRG